MAARAILFDLDGTIWDSYPWYARIIAEEGGPSEASTVGQLRGGSSIVYLLGHYGIPEHRLVKRATELSLYPSVRKTLDELERRGTPRGVMTSLPGRLALKILNGVGLNKYFETVIHAGNCHFRKPKPQPLLAALKAMAIPVSKETFYVGDRLIDAQAATQAGLEFAWASYGYGDSCPPATSIDLKRFSDVLSL